MSSQRPRSEANDTPLSIGIVGAGVAGLSLALACRSAGLDNAVIYERNPNVSTDLTASEISPNAARVLYALGVKDALHAVASTPSVLQTRAARSGYLISQRPLGEFCEARYGAAHLIVEHRALLDVLVAAVKAWDIPIITGTTCSVVTSHREVANIQFADGTHADHDVVIGCDGIDSAVAAALKLESAVQDTAFLATQAVVATPAALRHPCEWIGPDGYLAHYPVSPTFDDSARGALEKPDPEQPLKMSTLAIWRDEATDEGLQSAADASLNQGFSSWHTLAREIVANLSGASAVHRLQFHPPMSGWSHQRIALAGDACHPTLPFLNQGAAFAIEDAWVLARMLERWEDEPVSGLREYERYRLPRARRLQLSAQVRGRSCLQNARWPTWKRNLSWALTSRYLPEIAMQKLDWLYGYDCIKGFD